jgi:hypothetical protein
MTDNTYDPEKTTGASDSSPPPPMYGEAGNVRRSYMTRIVDSFKRDPNAHVMAKVAVGADGKVFDSEGAAQATATSPLARKLKGRHLQMIAIGGSIGKFSCFTSFARVLTTDSRYGSLRRLRKGSCGWWPCLTTHRIWLDWCHVILHCSCIGRNGRVVPCCRFILSILDSFLRSCMGFRYGLEVSIQYTFSGLSLVNMSNQVLNLVMPCSGSSCFL